jgi:hypothetical protein
MRRGAVIAMLLVFVCGAATAVAAGHHGKRIGQKRGHGSFASATASGVAQTPARVYVRVKARPRQGFTLFWATTCSGNGKVKSKHGDFSGVGTKIKRVKLAMRKPDFCGVGASGSLNGTGKILVQIYNRKRK